jgi:hypothetical protein
MIGLLSPESLRPLLIFCLIAWWLYFSERIESTVARVIFIAMAYMSYRFLIHSYWGI